MATIFKEGYRSLGKGTKRATKLMIRDKSAGYHERLRLLRLTTLETRRLREVRGDLIEVFKIVKGFEEC